MESTNGTSSYQKPRYRFHKKRIFVWGTFLFFIFVLLAGVRFVSVFKSLQNQEAWAQTLREEREGPQINYLFFGVDSWGDSLLADKLVVVQHDTSRSKVRALFIPGNTLVEMTEYGEIPIGKIYSKGKSRLVIEKVQEIIASPIHHYIRFNYQGFIPLVDTIGGVAVRDLGEVIDGELLPEEDNRIYGTEFYRYYTASDVLETPFGQLERQRRAILAVINETVKYTNFWTAYRVARVIAPYLETDLTWKELNALYYQFKDYSFEDVELVEIPGEPVERHGEVYWLPEEVPFLFFTGEGHQGDLKPSLDEITVEVLNGSGIKGAASVLGKILEEEGFTVVNIGNADHFNYEQTLIFWRESKREAAAAVAALIPQAKLADEPAVETGAQITVIIGRNYNPPN